MICTKEGFSKTSAFTAEATQSMEALVESLAIAAADAELSTRSPGLPAQSMIKTYFSSFTDDSLPRDTTPLNVVNDAIAATPNDGALYLKRALVNLTAESFAAIYDDAQKAVELLRAQEDADANTLTTAIDLYGTFSYLLGNITQAKDLFEEVIARDSKRAAVYIRMCVIDCESGGFDAAILRVTTAITLAPNSADAYLQRGQLFLLSQQIDKAMADFLKSVELNPESYMSQVQLAVLRLRTGQSRDLSDFTRIVQQFNTIPDVYNFYAQILIDMQQYGEALTQLNKALSINPTHTGVLMQLALASALQNKGEEARAHALKVIEIEPKLLMAYEFLAQLAVQSRDATAALGYYEKATKFARNKEELKSLFQAKIAMELQLDVLKELGGSL